MLIPSIDLLGGRIVQLVQGEKLRLAFDDFEYWIQKFSKYPLVQLIDLDAAMRQGENSALVAQIAKRLPVQAGGGIHSRRRRPARHRRLGALLLGRPCQHSIRSQTGRRRWSRTHRRRHRHKERPHRREGVEGAGGAHAR
jgi:hypothetical protein